MSKIQFGAKAEKYAEFVASDPMRSYLHYPSVERNLGSVDGILVLDHGCGDGLFPRRLAAAGAKVVGYDASKEMIAKARESEASVRQGIEYIEATPLDFHSATTFDHAVSVMVLPYSPNAAYLKNFFASAHRHLASGGKFVSVVFNPNFKAFGDVIGNRKFVKLSGKKVRVHFLHPDSGEPIMAATLRQFSKGDYIKAAEAAGFESIFFKPLSPNRQGISVCGRKFWKSVRSMQPYALITVRKS